MVQLLGNCCVLSQRFTNRAALRSAGAPAEQSAAVKGQLQVTSRSPDFLGSFVYTASIFFFSVFKKSELCFGIRGHVRALAASSAGVKMRCYRSTRILSRSVRGEDSEKRGNAAKAFCANCVLQNLVCGLG